MRREQEVDRCSSVDGTERNDGGEILGTSGQDLRSIETNDPNVSGHDAPTAGGEEVRACGIKLQPDAHV